MSPDSSSVSAPTDAMSSAATARGSVPPGRGGDPPPVRRARPPGEATGVAIPSPRTRSRMLVTALRTVCGSMPCSAL